MAATRSLPIEVCERIIEATWDDRYYFIHASSAALSNCALVCRNWRPRAQRVLFEYVTLRDKNALYRFAEILDASPELGSYVRILALRGYLHVPFSPAVLLPTVLRGGLPKLRVLYMLGYHHHERISNPLPEGMKELPSLPIHRYFPSLLRYISHIRCLNLRHVRFPSFGDFARILNALTTLEELYCGGVSWAVLGQEPPCMAKNRYHNSRNTFLPNLHTHSCYDMDEHGKHRLISTLDPSLRQLWLMFPDEPSDLSSEKTQQPAGDGSNTTLTLNREMFPRLYTLVFWLLPSPTRVEKIHRAIYNALSSWTASHEDGPSDASARYLFLGPWDRMQWEREDFVQVLHAIGTAVEAALCAPELPGYPQNETRAGTGDKNDPCKATVIVQNLGDRLEWEEWWTTQVAACFPTLSSWNRLEVRPSQDYYPADQWRDCDSSPIMQEGNSQEPHARLRRRDVLKRYMTKLLPRRRKQKRRTD